MLNIFTKVQKSGWSEYKSGADPRFQARRAHLKEMRRAEGGAKIFGVFRVKNHDFTPTILFFPTLGGGARRVRPAPAMGGF